MNSWSENINLACPLKDVSAPGSAVVTEPANKDAQEQWHASFERGRIEGEKALSEQLLKQRAEVHELLQGVLNSLRQAVPQVIRETESVMVSLALEVAQKLVADMPISVPMLEAAIRDALAQVEGTAQFTVRLHPSDLELLQKSGSPILTVADGASEFRFLGSPEVGRGGCLVQTRFGTVDARRETKFDLLKRNLLTC
jgi:flagellar biosynthesis/type III secretory pathway protein FliH